MSDCRRARSAQSAEGTSDSGYARRWSLFLHGAAYKQRDSYAILFASASSHRQGRRQCSVTVTRLKSPPAPSILLDAREYYHSGRIYLSADGNYRWSAKASLPSWAHAGRIASPFNQAMKQYFGRLHEGQR